mmetsp:Transcript_8878/g.25596  ORF Transcript_8878/g.25596 Transcript_8878/m.25596 type:complete len:101 (+) Transcript_8878:49-351(+)
MTSSLRGMHRLRVVPAGRASGFGNLARRCGLCCREKGTWHGGHATTPARFNGSWSLIAVTSIGETAVPTKRAPNEPTERQLHVCNATARHTSPSPVQSRT